MKELQPCGCNCGKMAHWNHLHILRDSEGHSFFVLDECREERAKELECWIRLKNIREALSGTWFFERWKAAKSWYCLNVLARTRLQGPELAAKIAHYETMRFIMPKWMAKIYSKINKPKK